MAAERRLSVDWPACKGHGLCAELVPELVTLDEWGYPILADRAVTRGVQSHAQRAVAACPTLALMLVEKPAQSATPKPGAADPISGAIQAVTGPNAVKRRSAPVTPPTQPVARHYERAAEPSGWEPSPEEHQPPARPAAAAAPPPTRRSRSRSAAPADDPITGAIQAVTGPNATTRRTPPTGMARHATPAYGQAALVPEAEAYEPGDSFFDDYAPRDAYEAKRPPSTRRQAKQEEQKPMTRREARRQRQ